MTINLAFDLWGIPVPKKGEHKQPDLCDLCGVPIEIEDKYYAGLTHLTKKTKIWAFTCLSYRCTQWLIAKKLFEKKK